MGNWIPGVDGLSPSELGDTTLDVGGDIFDAGMDSNEAIWAFGTDLRQGTIGLVGETLSFGLLGGSGGAGGSPGGGGAGGGGLLGAILPIGAILAVIAAIVGAVLFTEVDGGS